MNPSNPDMVPHDEAAEKGLLAGCMIGEDAGEVVTGCLAAGMTHEAFYHVRHQVIFDALTEIQAEGLPLEEITVLDWLKGRTVGDRLWLKAKLGKLNAKKNLLEFVGGMSTVIEINNLIETTAHVPYWREIVLAKWKLRRLIGLCKEAVAEATEHEAKVDEVVAGHQAAILDLAHQQGSTLRRAAEFFPAALAEINAERENSGAPGRFGTGFIDIDAILFTLRPTVLYTLAARPGCGKSSLAGQIGFHAAYQRGIPVLLFSLEMSAEEWGTRMIFCQARVSTDKFRDGIVSHAQTQDLILWRDRLAQAPIEIEENADLNIYQMRAVARSWATRNVTPETGGLIIIDYLQLITGSDRRMEEYERVSEASRETKKMAKELRVPVLQLSQLNREVEKRSNPRPKMSDLRASGAIEQDSDVILFLSPTEKDSETGQYVATGKMLLDIAKNRHGKTDMLPLTFIRGFTRFENYSGNSYAGHTAGSDHYHEPEPEQMDAGF